MNVYTFTLDRTVVRGDGILSDHPRALPVVAALALKGMVIGMSDEPEDDLAEAITGAGGDGAKERGLDFHIRLNEVEKVRLVEHAAAWALRSGLSGGPQRLNLSMYARETLLAPHVEEQAVTKGELVDFRDKVTRLATQIAKVGTNINQVARVANSRGVVLDRQVLRLVEEMRPLLRDSQRLVDLMIGKCL
ncbi:MULTISPECIES: plasmid mobilization relaxosome protein MobC [Actinomycetes]|uniref:MobC family plasmid mobilization relaxosome protein n=2 Tax=Bifidobacterium TaxID=1678 RepID=A0A971CZ83_9BIFI|nr:MULTISPECIES: plasmid mobilization relaxosome protein MobC [Actinomycetes]MCI1868965.1 MobC family plasmid mobilization relaxosome protein [Bifidobacterium crudilactis]MDN5995574.1 MobC family plasmid mobilization relaxosome protein [Acidipropionibacterium jensenii]NLT79783.1 MobC family plasmid mobilization relaxosome protein [Bifidobacterium crudilactis]